MGGGGGGVTPIDSIVTIVTAVGQWSTVKATQKGAVNGQSSLRNTVNGRSQCRTDGRVRTNSKSNSAAFHLRTERKKGSGFSVAVIWTRIDRQALGKSLVLSTVKIVERSKAENQHDQQSNR